MGDNQKLQIQAVGMVWYKRENYERIRTICEDGNNLHDTYDEWFKAAEIGRKGLESQGARVICVDIDPVEFPVWCRNNDMKLNAAARNRYANLAAYKAIIEKS
jgi:hypothetical protein